MAGAIDNLAVFVVVALVAIITGSFVMTKNGTTTSKNLSAAGRVLTAVVLVGVVAAFLFGLAIVFSSRSV